MKEYTIFSDGACSRGKTIKAGAAFYNLTTGDKVSFKLDKKYNGTLTNNIAELMAILGAFLFYVKDAKELKLHIKSDSMYCINSLTKWYKTWEKNNWKLKGNKEVANKKLMQLIISVMNKYNSVKFSHVRSHQKKPTPSKKQELIDWEGNDRADKLAVDGMYNGVILDIYTY